MNPIDGTLIRRVLQNASRNHQANSSLISSSATSTAYFFGFRYLILNHKTYYCLDQTKHKHGAKILNILKQLRDFSLDTPSTIENRPHCHDLRFSQEEIKKKELKEFVDLSPNKLLFQMGSDNYAERIIGFFDKDNKHLFQVCIFDLDHKIFPVSKKRVFN